MNLNFLKQHWLTILLSAFLLVLPWQTRYIFGFVPLGASVSEYGILSIYASQVVLVAGLALGYAKFGRPHIRQDYRRPLLLVAVLLGFILVSSAWSAMPQVSLMAFFHLAVAMLFFTALLDERAQLPILIAAFALGLMPPTILGAWQVLFAGSGASSVLGLASREAARLGDSVLVLADGTRVLRAYGSFPHPNIFGGFLAVGVIAAGWLARRVKDFGLVDSGLRHKLSWLALVLSAFLFLGLLLTASRSAILGLALGLGLALLVFRMKRTALARLVVIPIAIVVIGTSVLLSTVAPSAISSLRGGGEIEARSLAERTEQYAEFPQVVDGAAWLVGHGVGTYVYALAEAYPGRDIWAYQPIHNVPLLLLGELGLLGLLLVLAWSSTIDKINFARFPHPDALAAFAMGNVVLVILFFDHYLWSSWSGLALIAFVMALTVRMGEDST